MYIPNILKQEEPHNNTSKYIFTFLPYLSRPKTRSTRRSSPNDENSPHGPFLRLMRKVGWISHKLFLCPFSCVLYSPPWKSNLGW